jgi:iron-sulfur cluster assembly accessory protein
VKKKLPINITLAAYDKILEIRKNKKIDNSYLLRLGVKSAGCGIASYIIGFDHLDKKDEVFHLNDIRIIIEKVQLMHLAGKTVDYGESEGDIGFIFRESS